MHKSYTHPPIEYNSVNHNIDFNFGVGWQYKRFGFSFVADVNLINFRKTEIEYTDEIIYNNSMSFFSRNKGLFHYQAYIKYCVFKKNYPIWIYYSFGNVLKLGVEINFLNKNSFANEKKHL